MTYCALPNALSRAAIEEIETTRTNEGAVCSPIDGAPHRERVNVLFLIDQLCAPGGAERMLLKTTRGLAGSRFRPYLATFKLDDRIPLFASLPCPFQELPLHCTYDFNALRVARQLRNFIRDHKIRIVHTFHETSDLWGGMVAKTCNKVVLIHNRRDMGYLRQKKHKIAYRLLAPTVDLVLAVCEEVRQHSIVTDRFPPNRVITLHNGIDLSLADALSSAPASRATLGIPEHPLVITTVGNIRYVKGIDTLVRTAHLLRANHPALVFLIVGSTEDRAYFGAVLQSIRSLGLGSNFVFTGAREDVLNILKASDIFCLPSRTEGFSNALIEAMACRLPCVATNVGGNPEAIVNGRSGFLVPPEEPRLLAQRLEQLVTSPSLRTSFGTEARRIVEEKFSFEAMIKKLISLYESVVR